jgi:hypothetical protein
MKYTIQEYPKFYRSSFITGKVKPGFTQKACMWMFIPALFIIAQHQKKTLIPFYD